MSDDESKIFVVKPSEIRLYAYCPRLLFFREHLGVKSSLWLTLRALLGMIYHFLAGLISRFKGYQIEDILEEKIGNIVIRGRPDQYRIDDTGAEVVEIKSSRGPDDGAWLSDLLQAATYGFILARRGVSRVNLVVRYANGDRRYVLTSELSSLVLRVIDDVILVKAYGALPVALRSRRKCEKCLYRVECFQLDSLTPSNEGELAEVGEWLLNESRVYKIA